MDFSLPCVLEPKNPIPESDQQVYFAPGSADLSAQTMAILDRQAGFLRRAQPPLPIQTHGFADTQEAATSGDMLQLSQRRAETVRDYLIAKGVNKSAILAVGSPWPFMIPKKEDEETLARMRTVFTELRAQ